MTPFDESNLSRYFFELTVNQLNLSLNVARRVALVWVAGTHRSQTWDTIVLLPGTTHPIDQKLVIHHTFNQDHATPFKTVFQVIDAQDESKWAVLAECKLDLAKLLTNDQTKHFTKPLKCPTDANASVVMSISTTTLVYNATEKGSSKDHSVINSSNASIVSKVSKKGLDGMKRDDLYKNINKMATKLAKVESEIEMQTSKLNKISKDATTTQCSIHEALQLDIKKKDRQIKILVRQLDEMHTALAISHQRELELGIMSTRKKIQAGNETLDSYASLDQLHKSSNLGSLIPNFTSGQVSSPSIPDMDGFNRPHKTLFDSISVPLYHTSYMRPFKGDVLDSISEVPKASTIGTSNALKRVPTTRTQAHIRQGTIANEPQQTRAKMSAGPIMVNYSFNEKDHLNKSPKTINNETQTIGPARVFRNIESDKMKYSNRLVPVKVSENGSKLIKTEQSKISSPGLSQVKTMAPSPVAPANNTSQKDTRLVPLPQVPKNNSSTNHILQTPNTKLGDTPVGIREHISYLEQNLIETKMALATNETSHQMEIMGIKKAMAKL
ncbi:hypothetical protein BdWA1_000498 [Babesia duncani]|uniref:C2 NT-type domain-containing protein n=1 Tax=Babesia duncani TaxID=323732 RepID=A0AAD9UPV6_9APIC|nr:hypothetical protein BdWA1_000498 [Babesia duncani]